MAFSGEDFVHFNRGKIELLVLRVFWEIFFWIAPRVLSCFRFDSFRIVQKSKPEAISCKKKQSCRQKKLSKFQTLLLQICVVDEATCAALEAAAGGGGGLASGATSFAESMSEDNLDGGARALGGPARRRVRKKKRRSGSLSRYSWVPSSAGGGKNKMR